MYVGDGMYGICFYMGPTSDLIAGVALGPLYDKRQGPGGFYDNLDSVLTPL